MQDIILPPALEEIYATGKTVAADGTTIPARGLSTPNNLHIIQALLRDYPTQSTIEIGLAHGGSALAIMTEQHKLHDAFRHTAIDPFQSSVWKGAGVAAVGRLGIPGFDCVEDYSCFVLPQMVKEGRRFGLIYVDGSHIFEDVFVDLYYSVMLLNEGGIILFDDSTDKHVHKVLRFADSNFSELLSRFDLSKYRASVKSRIADRLGRSQITAYRKIKEGPRPWNAPFTNF